MNTAININIGKMNNENANSVRPIVQSINFTIDMFLCRRDILYCSGCLCYLVILTDGFSVMGVAYIIKLREHMMFYSLQKAKRQITAQAVPKKVAQVVLSDTEAVI